MAIYFRQEVVCGLYHKIIQRESSINKKKDFPGYFFLDRATVEVELVLFLSVNIRGYHMHVLIAYKEGYSLLRLIKITKSVGKRCETDNIL